MFHMIFRGKTIGPKRTWCGFPMVSDGFPQRPRFCFRVRRMKVGMSATSDEVLDAKATGEISYGLL